MKTNGLYEDLFRSYFKLAVFYAMQFVRSRNTAEDIVQDVFVNLLDVDLKAIRDPRRYLFRCVRNAATQYMQSSYGRSTTPPLDVLQSIYDPVAQDDQLESEEAENLKKLVVLYEQVEKLSPRARQIFKMIAIERRSYAETARQLAISLHSVKTQMSRSFQLLRKRMGKL